MPRKSPPIHLTAATAPPDVDSRQRFESLLDDLALRVAVRLVEKANTPSPTPTTERNPVCPKNTPVTN